MKRKILFILLASATLLSHTFSQEKVLDSAYLKCQYKYIYVKDTLELSTFEDLLLLQIGKNISKSYSYYTFQSDSLAKEPEGQKTRSEIFNQALEKFKVHRDKTLFLNSFPRRRGTAIVYKNYPDGKITVTDNVTSDYVMYEDELNTQNWKISDSAKIILGYSCQKAECDYRGRHWTAWFAPDIPVSDGPWKLGGLPGLIMEVYDQKKHYAFTLAGIEKVSDEPIVFSQPIDNNKYRKIERKEFLKAQWRHLSNNFISAETGMAMGVDKPVYQDLIERDYR